MGYLTNRRNNYNEIGDKGQPTQGFISRLGWVGRNVSIIYVFTRNEDNTLDFFLFYRKWKQNSQRETYFDAEIINRPGPNALETQTSSYHLHTMIYGFPSLSSSSFLSMTKT